MVFRHHQLFRRAPAGARPPRPLAREGARHAAQLDRPFRGPALTLRARSRHHAERRGRGRRLHHAARHAVRRQVHGDLAGSPARGGGSGEQSGARRLHRRVQTPRHRATGHRDRGEKGLRHRDEGHSSLRSRLEAPGLCRQLHFDGLRHRRHLRLSGARPARPRLRQQIRARQYTGRVPAGTGSRDLRHYRHRLRRRWAHDQFALPRRHEHRGGEGGGRPPAGARDPRQPASRHPSGQFPPA